MRENHQKMMPWGSQNRPKMVNNLPKNAWKSQKVPKKSIFWGIVFLMIFWTLKMTKKGSQAIGPDLAGERKAQFGSDVTMRPSAAICWSWYYNVVTCCCTAEHGRAPQITAEHSRAHHSTAEHTAEHSKARQSTAEHSRAQKSTAEQGRARQNTAQHSRAQQSTAENSREQQRTAENSRARQSTAQHSRER